MVIVFVVLMHATSCYAAPSVQQVIDLMQKNFRKVKDYKVDAVLTVKSKTVNVTGMLLTVYYKQPGKLHIDSKDGFAMIPRDIVFGNPAEDLPRYFDIAVIGTQIISGRKAFVVKLSPKDQLAQGHHGMKAWIDAERGLILSTAGGEYPGPSFTSKWSYTFVDGKYWLPSEIRVEMKAGQSRPAAPKHGLPSINAGTGATVIKFKNYKVNKGIPDSVFKKPAK